MQNHTKRALEKRKKIETVIHKFGRKKQNLREQVMRPKQQISKIQDGGWLLF